MRSGVITADRDRCSSSGMCVLGAPRVFDQADDDGSVVVRMPVATGDDLRVALESADTCPTRAISVSIRGTS